MILSFTKSNLFIDLKSGRKFFTHFILITFLVLGICSVSLSQTAPDDSLPIAKEMIIDSLGTDSLSDSLKQTGAAEKEDSPDTVDYKADYIFYEAENKLLNLRGNAQLKSQNITLTADTICYDKC